MITFHRHRYEAVAVDHRRTQPTLLAPMIRTTIILHRCRCGDVYSQLVNGDWTLAQIRGETPGPATVPPLPAELADRVWVARDQ